jgi:signal transduction histidine kinase
VDRLINDILLLINFEVKRHSCILKINTANVDTNKLIKNDTVTLTQVINNLISNAIDSYNKEPGVINFNISEVSDMLILSVQDNGCGIDKEIQTKLFKQMITTKGMDGMGLGLFLSKTMLHARCNGKILFSSEKDKGTTMVVKIPFENTGGIQDVEEN